MSFLLLYPLLLVLLFAACATLAWRLLGGARLARRPALIYGLVAFILVHGVFLFVPLRGILPASLPFVGLLLWGTLFFSRQPLGGESAAAGFEQAFFRSLLAAGFYVVTCMLFGGLVFWLEGPALRGGG